MIFAGAGQRLSSGYKAITSSRDTGNRGSLTSSHDNDASSQPSHTKQNYKTESKLPGLFLFSCNNSIHLIRQASCAL